MEEVIPKIGDVVIFTDELQKKVSALITCVHGPADNPTATINVVYVSLDETQTDSYGRQIVRKTSVTHVSNTSAPGYFWEF